MNLRALLNGVPRTAFIAAVPVAAFLLAVGVGLGMSGDSGDDKAEVQPTQNLGALAELATPTNVPTKVPTAVPTATPVPDRDDCSEIEGTDYRSDTEREWYLENCTGATTAVSSGGGGGGGTTTTTIDYTTSGPAYSGGGEYALGDRLIIPAIGVDTPVYGTTVGPDGQMPDPYGYFYAVWYDFAYHSNLGGYVDGGNLVLAGHVDCAACHNGASGAAVFYYTRNLSAGDTIQYITSSGEVVNYVVTSAADYGSGSNWSGIVSSGAADLTIITCNGTFNPAIHEYDLRRVVYATRV